MYQKKIEQLAYKFSQKRITGTGRNSRYTNNIRFFRETIGQKQIENRGAGECGIHGLGTCGHPSQPWPLTIILEETDEYIVACCDAGCGTILIKNPPLKKKKKSRRRTKLVKDLDGNLVPERKKTHEDNIFE